MAAAYRMTPRRRAALRRAQIASAKKRKLKRRKRIAAVGIGVTSAALAGAVAGQRISRSRKRNRVLNKNMANYQLTGRVVRQRGRTNSVPVRKGVFKAPGRSHFKQGAPYYVKRNRPGYDASRREAYAKSRKLKY